MRNNSEYPESYLGFLYEGLKAFYPFYFYPPDEASKIVRATKYEGYTHDQFKNEFLPRIFDMTGTNEIEGAIRVLLYWMEPEVTPTLPSQLDELVENMKKAGKLEEEARMTALQKVDDTIRLLKEQQKIPQPPTQGISETDETQVSPAEREVELQPLAPTLPPMDQISEDRLNDLRTKAKNNPDALKAEIADQVQQGAPEHAQEARAIANRFVDRLQLNNSPVAVLTGLAANLERLEDIPPNQRARITASANKAVETAQNDRQIAETALPHMRAVVAHVYSQDQARLVPLEPAKERTPETITVKPVQLVDQVDQEIAGQEVDLTKTIMPATIPAVAVYQTAKAPVAEIPTTVPPGPSIREKPPEEAAPIATMPTTPVLFSENGDRSLNEPEQEEVQQWINKAKEEPEAVKQQISEEIARVDERVPQEQVDKLAQDYTQHLATSISPVDVRTISTQKIGEVMDKSELITSETVTVEQSRPPLSTMPTSTLVLAAGAAPPLLTVKQKDDITKQLKENPLKTRAQIAEEIRRNAKPPTQAKMAEDLAKQLVERNQEAPADQLQALDVDKALQSDPPSIDKALTPLPTSEEAEAPDISAIVTSHNKEPTLEEQEETKEWHEFAQEHPSDAKEDVSEAVQNHPDTSEVIQPTQAEKVATTYVGYLATTEPDEIKPINTKAVRSAIKNDEPLDDIDHIITPPSEPEGLAATTPDISKLVVGPGEEAGAIPMEEREDLVKQAREDPEFEAKVAGEIREMAPDLTEEQVTQAAKDYTKLMSGASSSAMKQLYIEGVVTSARENIPLDISRVTARVPEAHEVGGFTTTPPPLTTEAKEGVIFLNPKKEEATVQLNSKEARALERDIDFALKDPRGFSRKLTKEILANDAVQNQTKNLTDKQRERIAQIVALDYATRLQMLGDQLKGKSRKDRELLLGSLTPTTNIAWVLNSLADPNNPQFIGVMHDTKEREDITTASQGLALASRSSDNVSKTYLTPVVGSKYTTILYGSDERVDYELSGERGPYSLAIVTPVLLELHRDYDLERSGRSTKLLDDPDQEIQFANEDIRALLQSALAASEAQGVGSRLSGIFSRGKIRTVEIGSKSGEKYTAVVLLVPQWRGSGYPLMAPALTGASPTVIEMGNTSIIWQVTTPIIKRGKGGKLFGRGLFSFSKSKKAGKLAYKGKAAITTAKALARKGAGKAVGGALGAKVGAAVGTALGPGIGTVIGAAIGAVIGFVVDLVVNKILKRFINWFKRNRQDAFALPALGMMGAGLFITGPVGALLFTGGVLSGLGYATAAAGGVTPLLTGLAGIGMSILIGLTSFVLAPMAIAFLATFLTAVIIAALTIFILNAGAFVVPGIPVERTLDLVENPYIDVIKRPQPPGPFENSELPLTVNYSITIHAKQVTLENITFEYTCEVIKEENPPACPDPNPPIPSPPDAIHPGAPYTIAYSQEFTAPDFENSIVIDTLTVTATTADGETTTESGTAAIVIGGAYTSCLVLGESWDESAETRADKAIIIQAIAELMKASIYMDKLCSQGDILVDWIPQYVCPFCGGWVDAYKHIGMFPAGIRRFEIATFTLTHETGHILAQVTDLLQVYYDNASTVSERPICSYYIDHFPSEDFAEMIGLFVAQSPSVNLSFSCINGQGHTFRTMYPNHWQFARDVIFEESLGW